MTDIRYKVDGDIVIEVSGHCERGDICSAVSTLVAALEGYLKNSDIKYDYRVGDGYCLFKIDEGGQRCREVIEMFLIGVMRLERMFPGLVKTIEI